MISHRTQWKYGSKSTAVASIATLHGSQQASPLKGVSDFVELAGNKVTQLFLLFSYALLMLNPLQNKVFTASQIGCRILCCCEGDITKNKPGHCLGLTRHFDEKILTNVVTIRKENPWSQENGTHEDTFKFQCRNSNKLSIFFLKQPVIKFLQIKSSTT